MQDFEVVGTRGLFRPLARVSFEQAADLVVMAMKHARALNLSDLLVNTRGLTGFEPLKIFERYAMAAKWVESGGAALRVAWVLKPELIDAQKIGIVMAQNRGASGDVFATEVEGLAWLDMARTGNYVSRAACADTRLPD